MICIERHFPSMNTDSCFQNHFSSTAQSHPGCQSDCAMRSIGSSGSACRHGTLGLADRYTSCKAKLDTGSKISQRAFVVQGRAESCS